ncbi:MAG: hypothetical protein M0R49_07205 [Limnochordia bacterium]|nr:hypothetical protein [Limnochordia bacterium]
MPCSYGSHLVSRVMVDGQNLMQLGAWNLMALLLIGIVHLLLGYGVYKVCERKAMLAGMLGHY